MTEEVEPFEGVLMVWPECPTCNSKKIYGLLPVFWSKIIRNWDQIPGGSSFICTDCMAEFSDEQELIWNREIYYADTGALIYRNRSQGEAGFDDMGFYGEEGE